MQQDTLLEERRCLTCGYNLKGLAASGVCPECGEPVQHSSRARLKTRTIDSSELGQSPLSYLLPLGAALFIFGAAGFVLLNVAYAALTLNLGGVMSRVGLVAGILWFFACLIIIRNRPAPGATDETHPDRPYTFVKLALVITQLAWIALPGVIRLMSQGPQGASIIAACIAAVGLFGFVALAILLGVIAEWASDFSMKERLHMVAWAIGMGVLVHSVIGFMHVLGLPFVGFLVFFSGLATLGIIIGTIALSLFSFLMLMQIRWGIINARERRAMMDRIEERRRRHQQQMAQSAAADPEPRLAPPAPVHRAEQAAGNLEDPSRPLPSFRAEARIDPTDDVTPYALEESDDSPKPPAR